MVGVVRGHDHSAALVGQVPHTAQNRRLVTQVQGRRWLIHDQDPPILDQSPGNERHLLLTAGELGEGACSQMRDPQTFQDLLGLLPVRAGGGAEQAQAGDAARQGDVEHREGERRLVQLGDVGDVAGHLTTGERGALTTTDLHPPRHR